MSKNDHTNVPDHQPTEEDLSSFSVSGNGKIGTGKAAARAEFAKALEQCKEGVQPTSEPKIAGAAEHVRRESMSRLQALESGVKALFESVGDLQKRKVDQCEATLLARHEKQIAELQDKVRQTARGVTKLAKGKSLGALGLPAEEEWIVDA